MSKAHESTRCILGDRHRSSLEAMAGATKRHLTLVSPYFHDEPVERLLECLPERAGLTFVFGWPTTALEPASMEPNALARLLEDPRADVRYVVTPRLHAKVYFADDREVVVTSANLTRPGLEANIEVGVRSTERALVAEVIEWFDNLETTCLDAQALELLFEWRDGTPAPLAPSRLARVPARETLRLAMERAKALRIVRDFSPTGRNRVEVRVPGIRRKLSLRWHVSTGDSASYHFNVSGNDLADGAPDGFVYIPIDANGRPSHAPIVFAPFDRVVGRSGVPKQTILSMNPGGGASLRFARHESEWSLVHARTRRRLDVSGCLDSTDALQGAMR